MAWEGVAGQLISLLARFLPQSGPRPVISYDLSQQPDRLVLEVRVGNRGTKPFYVSEIWLHSPAERTQVFIEHPDPDVIPEHSGRVYPVELPYPIDPSYSQAGTQIWLLDATGKAFTKRLQKNALTES